MKITINNKTTTIDLTKHNWTLEKQFDKFLGEWEEFLTAYKTDYLLIFDEYKYNVIQEGLDVIKSGHKYVLMLNTLKKDDNAFVLNDTILCYSELFDISEKSINIFIENSKNSTLGYLAILDMLKFLKEFCLENDEDLFEHIKINNTKTNSRGTDKKMYFNEIEESILFQIHELLIEDGHEAHAEDFMNMLERIEE